jgi:uncharacterized protein YyaL (SSP411 family)
MEGHKFTNELIHETSPYLLEHAHNPVNWYPWGEKALTKAKKENKPLIISIGYAACHWCHVMERESYSDENVASYMNEHFVAIKIDREERPDIDQIYMDAIMMISGNGGWPLNAFALPDGRPFYAVTYLPKGTWMNLLEQVQALFGAEPEKILEMAENITQGLNRPDFDLSQKTTSGSLSKEFYTHIFESWLPIIDFELGGYSRAPKFPLPTGWEFLLQYYYITKNTKALQSVSKTLHKMALGGIFDQIGGGFARYATDMYWKVPHFEKMLYDNGQLVSLYAHAFQLTKDTLFERIIRETLDFTEREMISPENGFYSSINADSEGEEGKFYVFTKREIESILPAETAEIISELYQVTREGNWEHGNNILHVKETKEEFALNKGISIQNLDDTILQAKKLLFEARSKRIRPTTDDKILTSWNALILKGYIDAFRALGDNLYLKMAQRNADFIRQQMLSEDGGLWRNYKNGKPSINAFLDDYAYTIQAFIELYQVTFHIEWLNLAKRLTDYVIVHFWDKSTNMFFYTSDISEPLVARKKEIPDNVMPSSNGVMAKNLFMLGNYFSNTEYYNLSKEMLNMVINDIPKGGPYYATWASLLGFFTFPTFEIAITGSEAQSKNEQMQSNFLPTSMFCGGMDENLPLMEHKLVKDKTLIYVCRNKTCKLPVEDVHTAIQNLQVSFP